MGARIADGPLAYTSPHVPVPLTRLEQAVLLATIGGGTGWQNLIPFNPRYAPHIPNYAGSAIGRTFPSAAGFHTSDIFYTDDEGVYYFSTRDMPIPPERPESGLPSMDEVLEAHRSRIRKIQDGRLRIPNRTPYMEGHNLWVANCPGSTLIIPAGDLAQHMIALLCYFLQNGQCLYDDIHQSPIEGIEQYRNLCDPKNALPLSFIEQMCLSEVTVELATSCYAGALMLQAMGLGGWMFDGLDPFSVLGASDNPEVKGLGFRYDTDERWPLPNPTGLPGVFEGFVPPHYPDMRTAVERFFHRKFGSGGPFHPETPGPYRETPIVRGSAEVHNEEFKSCIALQAEYIYRRFGKFPGTVPTIFLLTYLQAHHLDLTFYDRFFTPGAYLQTHAEHMEKWH